MMIRTPCEKRARLRLILRGASLPLAMSGLLLFANGCGKEATLSAPPAKAPESQVHVSATASAVLVDTPAAEFAIAPNGYITASLLTVWGGTSPSKAGCVSMATE